MRRHVHPLTKAAAIGKASAEMQSAAQIWMSLFAEVTALARLRRVDSDSDSWLQGLKITRQRFPADRFDSRRKFVAKNKRTLDGRVPNPRIPKRVEVAAANSRYTYAQQNFSGSGWPGMRDLLHPQITWPVQARSQHGGWVRARIDWSHAIGTVYRERVRPQWEKPA
jgi:hypothetical protein